MLKKLFDTTRFLKSSNVPTLIAYDGQLGRAVIGEAARRISSSRRPVIQNFKHAIGDSDALFEGRHVAAKGSRPQKNWEFRSDGAETQRLLSTRNVTKSFLEQFFGLVGKLPSQLIIGTPSSKDSAWLSQYRTHLKDVLNELGYGDTSFFPEPFAVFQYYRHVEKLIPESSQPLTVLVVDFGGGTLDSCIIQTTPEGNLSRGGTTSLPLGLQSYVGAGKEIDLRLLKLAIKNQMNTNCDKILSNRGLPADLGYF